MKKRYIVAGVLILLSFSSGLFRGLVFSFVLGWTLYVIDKIEKLKKDDQLTQNEKIQVVITEFLNPVVAGGFYYYCLKDKYPKKANQANKYSFMVLGIEILFGVFLAIIFYSH